jgi:hypothetical protein
LFSVKLIKLFEVTFEDVRPNVLNAPLYCVFEEMGVFFEKDFHVGELGSFTAAGAVAGCA